MRIVVFICKSIMQQCRAFWWDFYQFLLISFTFTDSSTAKKMAKLKFIEEEQAVAENIEGENSIILSYENGLDSVFVNNLVFFMHDLEQVPAFLESLGPQRYHDLWVVILRPSLWCSQWEQNISLGAQWYSYQRNIHLKNTVLKSVKIAQNNMINLLIVDDEACFGYKNSALIKRLFYKENK